MRPTKYGVVVVVEREGRFLVIRRAASVIAPNAWCFVGGAIEAARHPKTRGRRNCGSSPAPHSR